MCFLAILVIDSKISVFNLIILDNEHESPLYTTPLYLRDYILIIFLYIKLSLIKHNN